ncbi:MAG: glycerophosphodiester phosphodiesterase [Halanaerobiaceae bacterium]|jgi:glycerophosphoryl diester phosphodiesterase|nr:glycerophosphodiester phosphodiesterase [Halanaerobiaceae bacterium]
MKTLIIGHRGAMGERPENTASSFLKAISDGADGIEFDVHLSADGIPVVIHDEKVDRTTDGMGFVSGMSLAELKKLNAGNEEYPDERILTLEETLDLIADKCKLINIELKQGPVFYQGMEERVLDIIRNYGIMEKIIISSFNHYAINEIKRKCPEVKCGLLYMAGLYRPWIYANNMGVEAIHPFVASINQEIIGECHMNNISVNVFEVNTEKTIKLMLAAGVDGIITDFPGLAVKIRDGGN